MRDGLDLTMFFVGIAVGICAVKLWYKCFKDERINMNDSVTVGSWSNKDEHVADVIMISAISGNQYRYHATCRCGKWSGSAPAIPMLQNLFDAHKLCPAEQDFPRQLR